MMMTYYNSDELEMAMKAMVNEHLGECLKKNRLSKDCVELIKHNFLAKFVHYNAADNSIEIGVEDLDSDSPYPEIKIHKYPLDGNYEWLTRKIRTGKSDLAFYGNLLNRRRSFNGDSQMVLV